MIDIATWRARIGLYRVCVGPSGRRVRVLRPALDGGADWLRLLSTITVEVVTLIIILLVLSGDIGCYNCFQLAASPGRLLETVGDVSNTTGYELVVFRTHLVRAMTCPTLITPVLVLYSMVSSIQLTTAAVMGNSNRILSLLNSLSVCTLQPKKQSFLFTLFNQPFSSCSCVTLNSSFVTAGMCQTFLREDSVIPVRAVISQQLMISGDVEINPGPTASDKPKIFELTTLKKPDGSKLEVTKWITSHKLWECVDFANMLLRDDVLVKKYQNEHKEKDEFVRIVLRDWLLRDDDASTDSAVPRTWAALAECVTDAGLDGAFAKAIRDSCSAELISDQPAPSPITTPAATPHTPALVQRYIDYLKDRYISKSPILKEKVLKVRPKEFIHLNLISNETQEEEEEDDEFKSKCLLLQLYGDVAAIKKKRRPMEMEDIGKSEDQSVAQHILVEGSPGIGKTMFSWELCRQWAEGKMLQDRDIVLMLQLRSKRAREAKSLCDLFHHDNDSIKQEVLEHITSVDGKGMFLVLEGYDELTEDQRTEGSILNRLLVGDCLPKASIMVTSRPLASDSLCPEFKESVDQHIEVVGFNDEDIKSYVKKACQKQPKVLPDLKSYIASNPFVSSIMYIPLQCATLTCLYIEKWRENKGKAFAPTTLTQLYTDLLLSSLIRYISDHPVYSRLKIRQLSDLPSEVQEQVWKLSQLAAEGLENRQFIFDSIPCDHMGLMQSAEEELVIGSSVSYCFLHLTLQEYLAALHWSRMGSEDMVRLVSETSLFPLVTLVREGVTKRSGYHWAALYFLSGLTKLTSVPLELLKKILSTAEDELNEPVLMGTQERARAMNDMYGIDSILPAIIGKQCNPYFFQLLFESQSNQLVAQFFKGEQFSLVLKDQLECFVTSWCVVRSDPTSQWSLYIEVPLLNKFIDQIRHEPHQYGSIKALSISILHPESSALAKMCSQIATTLPSTLHSLDCLMLAINLANIIHIAPLLSCINKLQSLKSVTICGLDIFQATPPTYTVIQRCPSLSSVSLLGTTGYFLRSFVLPNMNTLKTVSLLCPVSDADFHSFCMCLRQTKSLKELQMTHMLETHQASEFASALKQNSSLLTVCIKEATDEGIKILETASMQLLETASMQHPTLLYIELPGGKKYHWFDSTALCIYVDELIQAACIERIKRKAREELQKVLNSAFD